MSKGKLLWKRLKLLYFKKRALELLQGQRQFKALGELLKVKEMVVEGKEEEEEEEPQLMMSSSMCLSCIIIIIIRLHSRRS